MMRSPAAQAGNLFSAPPAPPPADIFGARGGEVQRDEFSHMVASSKPMPQPEPAAKAAPPPPKSSNLPVILIVGGLLLVAIVLVLVFALMR
jgi:hypothetical protein